MVNDYALPDGLHSQSFEDGEGRAWRVRRAVVRNGSVVFFLECGKRRVRAEWRKSDWFTSDRISPRVLDALAPREQVGPLDTDTRDFVRSFAHLARSRAELASATGRTSQSVGDWMKRNGMRQVWDTRWSEDDVAELAQMRADGATVRELAEWFGRPPQGVRYQLRKLEAA